MQGEGFIANDLEQFRRDIEQFGQACDFFRDTFFNVTEALNNLNGMWEGGAHDALMERFVIDAEYIGKYISFLEDYRNELEEAEVSYRSCEADVEDSVRIMLQEVSRR